MCCSVFWAVYSRYLAVIVSKLMGVQSIWLFLPCSLLGANPPLISMDPSLSRERSALKTERKIPQAVTSDDTIHYYCFKKRNTEVQTERPSSCSSSSCSWLKKLFLFSFAKSKLGNKWHLKTRHGLLTLDFVWRSPCSSLWLKDAISIPLSTFFFFFFFVFFHS